MPTIILRGSPDGSLPHTRDYRNVTEQPGPMPENSDVALGLLPSYVGYNLRRTQAASFRHLDQLARELNLTPGQFSLLSLLAGNPGISQKALSQVTGVDTSTMSPALDSLARRGLINRARAAHDRRSYSLSLSPEGEKILAAMREHVERQERVMADALEPGERDHLLAMLKRIAKALNA
jgi:DNA-binding MarR family transcriptional regulator